MEHTYFSASPFLPFSRFLLILTCSLQIAGLAFAQKDVSGLVVDQQGNPLTGASVELRQSTTGLARYGVHTTSGGRFLITSVRPGAYTIVVSFLGYSPWKSVLNVQADEDGNRPRKAAEDLRIVLRPTLIAHPEVIVSFRRADSRINPMTVSNIGAEEVQRAPPMKDLPVLLARQPSITYHSENGNAMGYSTLRMRGFDQRRLAISINGIPQNDPEEFNVFWVNFFDIQGVVEDIQVQRGAGSSLYGPAAIGGAINIRAMPYRPNPFARFEVGRGTYNTQRYTAEVNSGLLSDRVVVFGRLSRLLSDGYRDWSWTEFWRFFGGITLYGERSSLTLQAYGGPQKDGLAFSGIPKAANDKTIVDAFGGKIDRRYNFSSLDRDTENFHQPHVELHHDLKLSSVLGLNQSLFWIQGKGYFDFGGTFRSADYLRLPDGFVSEEERGLPLFISRPDVTALFRANLDQWQIGWVPRVSYVTENLSVTSGIELRLHRSLRWGRIEEGVGLPAELVGSSNDVRVYSFRSEKKMASIFVSSVYRIHQRWAVQGDLQLTYRKYRFYEEVFFGNEFEKPYVFANPRLGITYNPGQPLSVYASAAFAQREPRMKSLYDGEEAGAGFLPAFELNPDGSLDTDRPAVDSENLVDIEFGAKWNGERARVSANFFYMDFRDEIVPSGKLDQFGVPRTGNADHTLHAGLEFDAALGIAPGLQLKGNATLSRNRFKRFDEFATRSDFSVVRISRDDNPIAGFPDESGNIGLVYVRHSLNAGINLAYVGTAYADNSAGRLPDGTRSDDLVIDPYTMLDATVAYEFSRFQTLDGLRISIAVNNVLDRKVLSFGNVGAVGPQFFPAATRHVFVGVRYTVQ